MLSHEGMPSLSLPATEEALYEASAEVSIRRTYDIDSVILRPRSLAAFQSLDLRLSYLPPHQSSITQNPHCRVASVQPHRCLNIQLASVNAHNRSQIHIIFPHAGTPSKGNTYLSHADQALFIDGCVIPALRASVPEAVYQQHPHDFIAARARASGVSDSRQRASTVRYTHLNYALPAAYVGAFWEALRTYCDQEASRRFRQPVLLYQIHGIKDYTSAPSPAAALRLFRRTYLSGMDLTHVDPDAFWVDIGLRDVPCPHPGAVALSRPWTLMYKPACLERLTAPGLRPSKYTQYGIRDFGCIDLYNDSVARHGDRPPLAQIKGYNSHKEIFTMPAKNRHPFERQKLPLLVLSEQVQMDWYNQNKRTTSAAGWRGSEYHREAYRQQKAQVFDMLREPVGGHASFGVRREARVLFACLERLDLDAIAPAGVVRPYHRADPSAHHPFWLVPTADLNEYVLVQVSSYALALERLIALASPSARGGLVAAPPHAQVEHTVTALLLQSLLSLTSSSGKPELYPWIFRSTRRVRPGPKARSQPPTTIRGLGVGALLARFGYVRLPSDDFNWGTPCLHAQARRDLRPPQQFRSLFHKTAPSRVPIRMLQTRATWLDGEYIKGKYAQFAAQVAAEDAAPPHPRERGGGGIQWTDAEYTRNYIFGIYLETVVYEFNKEVLHELKTFVRKIDGLGRGTTAFRLVYPNGSVCDTARQVLTIRYLDNLFIRIYRTLGQDKCYELFGLDGSLRDLALPMPTIGKYRGTDPTLQSWNGWLAYTLRARDFEDGCVWTSKAFAQRIRHVESQWRAFCRQSPHPSIQRQEGLFDAFVHRFVGRFIGVTPNCQRGKFLQVNYQLVNGDRKLPHLFATSFFVPAIATDPGNFAHLDIRARWAQISEDVPAWLQRAVYSTFGRLQRINIFPATVPPERFMAFTHAMRISDPGGVFTLAPGFYSEPEYDPTTVRALSLIHKMGNTPVPGLFALPSARQEDNPALERIRDAWADDRYTRRFLNNEAKGFEVRLYVLDFLFAKFEEQEAATAVPAGSDADTIDESEDVEELDMAPGGADESDN